MIQRLVVAALLIAAVLVTLYYLSIVWWLALGTIALLLAGREYAALTTPGAALTAALLMPPLVLLPWIWAFLPDQLLGFLLIAWLFIACGGLLGARDLAAVGITVTSAMTGLFYLGAPVALTARYHPDAGGQPGLLVLLLLMVWASDAAAFLVGRSMGSRRITPRLSPNKTLEGYVAALAAPGAVGALLAPTLLGHGVDLVGAGIVGLLIGLAATLGDLFESALKRGAGVKDSSALLPGHGGILDRIDSFLFALPAYSILVPWMLP